MKNPPNLSIPVPPTIQNIQAVRAIAAVLVVWAHISWFMAECFPNTPVPEYIVTPAGAVGVDLFFVISGFVISLTADKRHHQPVDFFLARIARVVPLYLVATLYEIAHHPEIQSAKSVWNGILYVPIFDWDKFSTPPVHVGWSLSFEMWFYVVFALLLTVLPPRRVVAILPIGFLVAAIAGSFYQGSWYLPHFVTHPLVLEFALGCVIYQARHRLRGAIPWLLLAFGLAGLGASIPYVDPLAQIVDELSGDTVAAWLRTLFWGVPSFLVVAGLVGLEQSRGIVLPRVLVSMGTISYSIYLVHAPVMRALTRLDHHIASPLVVAAIQIPFCILGGWLCYVLIERPLTTRAQLLAKYISGHLRPRAVIVPTSQAVEA